MGYGRGFDTVIWIRGQEADPYVINDVSIDLSKWHEKNYPIKSSKLHEQIKREFIQYLKNTAHWKSEEDHFVAQVMKKSAKWLKEQIEEGRRDRLFLWVDSFDPHEPWDPPEEYYQLYAPPEYRGKPIIMGGGTVKNFTDLEIQHIRAQYAGEITLVDKWIGWFFDKVMDLGLWENTLIILLSDHGEPLGEHGIIRKVQPWPYEELSKIALIVRHPEEMGKGEHIKSFVETVDIMPTILDFLGINKEIVVDGKSLIALMMDKAEEIKEFAISGHYRRSWSIRNREFTLYIWPKSRIAFQQRSDIEEKTKPELYRTDRDYVPPPPKNYDLRRDLPEKENIIEIEKDVAQELEVKLKTKMLSLLGY